MVARELDTDHRSYDDRSNTLPDRLGLNVPYEWWPSAAFLKGIEASGFGWVQIPSPPTSVLADARNCIRHAGAVADSLSTTGLRAILHAPGQMLAGDSWNDRAFEGVLAYAAECGAEQVVYHAHALPNDPASEGRLHSELRSLARLAELAERLEIKIAIENLAPVYPGPEVLSSQPQTLRGIAKRIGSDGLGLCLDIGHANISADLRHTSLELLVNPVLDTVSVFHVHDNLGVRRRREDQRPELDPLRFDLHLPPGRGSLDWDAIAPALREHSAPIILEVHPPRPRAGRLLERALRVLAPSDELARL